MAEQSRVVSAASFYDGLASGYEDHFTAVHRAAYDDLAWEAVGPLAASANVGIVDVGCGVGRWSERFRGFAPVRAFDPSARMCEVARARFAGPGPEAGHGVAVFQADVDTAEIEPKSAHLVSAMGSVQYAPDPIASIATMASWLAPGGTVAVLVDSWLALVLELERAGKTEEAEVRRRTGHARFELDGQAVEHRLLDADALAGACEDAGLVDVHVRGLLVGASLIGRDSLVAELTADYEGRLAVERELAADRRLADLGKQLLVTARRR